MLKSKNNYCSTGGDTNAAEYLPARLLQAGIVLAASVRLYICPRKISKSADQKLM